MNLKKRKTLVTQLVNYEGDPQRLVEELRKFGWDCDKELAEIKIEQIEKVLKLYLKHEISENDLKIWAECLECREDISFETTHEEVISETIFLLANPEINYEIDHILVKKMINKLRNNK